MLGSLEGLLQEEQLTEVTLTVYSVFQLMLVGESAL